MTFIRPRHGVARQAASPVMFVDPSGRRWQKIQIISDGLDTLALSVTHERLGPPLRSDTTGRRISMVGQGDYVRKLVAYAKSSGYGFTTGRDVHPRLADRLLDIKSTTWDTMTLNLGPALNRLGFAESPRSKAEKPALQDQGDRQHKSSTLSIRWHWHRFVSMARLRGVPAA